jgi:hypothetical protein
MAEINLDNEHSDFIATTASRTKSRDLYEGIRVVKAAGQTYLYKEPREKDEAYTLRLKRAVLDPWVAKIIAARQGVLFRKQPERELPANMEAYLQDVDRKHTPAAVFFEECAHDAQVDGIHWVAVDMPTKPEGGFRSRADETATQHRPFFERHPAENVIDWETDDDGNLLWAVVRWGYSAPREEPGTAQETKTRYKVWTRDSWTLYQQAEDAKGAAKIQEVASGVNTTGVVPLVPFYGVKRTEFSGWPVCDTILDHILLIYNKASDLDRSERITSHPTPYVISPSKIELVDGTEGFWVESKVAGVTCEVGMLEPSGVAFDSIRASIQSLIAAIYATALGQAKKDSAQVENAETQKEGRKAFNASLKTASQSYEESENQCWRIFRLWMGSTSGEINVTYNRDFDDSIIDEAMISRLFELAGSRPVITRNTLLDVLKAGEIIPPDIDNENEISELDAEESQRAAEIANTLRPAAAALPPEPDST